MANEIKPMAIPGIHNMFYNYFLKIVQGRRDIAILDVGAGHGAFTKKLYDAGFSVQACDLSPEFFYFTEVECKKADISKELPYANNSFDIIVAVEVMEHLIDHELFFKECARILKPGGKFLFSTPNILSLCLSTDYRCFFQTHKNKITFLQYG